MLYILSYCVFSSRFSHACSLAHLPWSGQYLFYSHVDAYCHVLVWGCLTVSLVPQFHVLLCCFCMLCYVCMSPHMFRPLLHGLLLLILLHGWYSIFNRLPIQWKFKINRFHPFYSFSHYYHSSNIYKWWSLVWFVISILDDLSQSQRTYLKKIILRKITKIIQKSWKSYSPISWAAFLL